jgi:hypothetical protein
MGYGAMGWPLSRFRLSAAVALVGLTALASTARAQVATLAPGADKAYTLNVDVLAKGGAVLGHNTFKCRSFLDTCEGVVPGTLEGKPLKVWVHGRAFDGRILEIQVEPWLKDNSFGFERTGFHDKPPKTGQEWEGELIIKHDHDYQVGWSVAQMAAARQQPPTLIARVWIRIED